MELHKQLLIDGQPLELVSINLTLDLMTPGRGVLVVKSERPVSGLVRLAMGYGATDIPVCFLGYVEQSFPMDHKQQRVLVRELPATLNRRVPLSVRHCRPRDILQEISGQTGLEFALGAGDWNNMALPCFYHSGGGFMALDALGAAFRIPRYIWQLQTDGRVFVGSWDESSWSGKTLPIDPLRLSQLSAGNSASLPVVPQARPGMRIQLAGARPAYITRVVTDDDKTRITWSVNPWDTRLKRESAA